jgi:C-terminal processing protease CtpA/Prc
MRSLYLSLSIFLVCSSSSTGQNERADTSLSACIRNAHLLLDEVFLLMQKNYYKKDSVQWDPLIKNAKRILSQSSDCEAAYQTVQWCFDQIKEEHSFVMPPVKAARYTGDVNSSKDPSSSKPLAGPIRHEFIEGDIGYISVPWIATTDDVICTGYADSLQSLIRTFDDEGVNKWIIDLRNNTGGNCWPMLAGLGPLLGNGIHGYFVSSKETIPISYKNGVVMQGKQARCIVTNPHTLDHNKNSIIILTGKKTSSAGEIVALTFKGRDNVYLYGEPTAGLTTANATYSLSDGSMLVLTVCKEADRNGKMVEGKIHPDELIQSNTRDEDVVKSAAIMFLQLQ